MPVYCDISEVLDLCDDLAKAFNPRRTEKGSRAGFAYDTARIIGPLVRDVVREKIEETRPDSAGYYERAWTSRIIFQPKRGKKIKFDGEVDSPALSFPRLYLRGIGSAGEGRVSVGHPDPKIVEWEGPIMTDNGFFIGVGKISDMNAATVVLSPGGSFAAMWRVADEGASASRPYRAVHLPIAREPMGKKGKRGHPNQFAKEGWIAMYWSGEGAFRMYVPQFFQNPKREGRHFFQKAVRALDAVKAEIYPQVQALAVREVERVFRKKYTGAKAKIKRTKGKLDSGGFGRIS